MRVPVSIRFKAVNWPVLALSVVVTLTAFGTYAFFAARHVGGCDTWAYFSDSLALRGKDIGVNGSLDPAAFPALVPLCYDLVGRNVVSLMPPGFPVLLAIGGLVRAQFWVSPVLGALSVVLLFWAIRRRCNSWIAVAFAALWATAPIVVWGGTQLMSDMAAATFALLAFVLFESARETGAGAALGFSFGIRPTNVLLLPALLLSRSGPRSLGRFCAGLGCSVFFWIVFAVARYGRLIPTGYAGNFHEFSTEHVLHQLGFFGKTTLSMFWPVVVLALLGLYKRPRASAPLVVWCLAYVGFYAFWKYPFTAWWWTRYLLPAYPPLFVLAAQGASELSDVVRRNGFGATTARALGVIAVFLICGRSVTYGETHQLFVRGFEEGYAIDSRTVARLVPANSLIGAVNFSGPLRLYAGLESFKYDHARAPELVDWAIQARRPVYAVIEPLEFDVNPRVLELRERYSFEDVAPLTSWDGLMLKRILPRTKSRRSELLLGTPAARRFLRDGWSGDEFDSKEHWVWAVGRRSTLEVPLEAGHDVLMTLVLAPFVVSGREQQVTVAVNDTAVASIDLGTDLEARTVQLPGRVVRAVNLIELRYAYAVSPKQLGNSADERELAVIIERISFREIKGL